MLMGRQAILDPGEITEYRVAGRHSDIPFSDLDQTRNTLGQLALAFAEASTPNTKPDLMLTAMPVKISLYR